MAGIPALKAWDPVRYAPISHPGGAGAADHNVDAHIMNFGAKTKTQGTNYRRWDIAGPSHAD